MIVFLMACGREEKGIKIVFTGDVILDRGVNDELKLYGDSLLLNSFQHLSKPDFLFINLEGTLTGTGEIQKDRFNFKSNKERAAILKKAGVSHVSIANNHIYDYGRLGYENTMDALSENQLEILGNSAKPTIIQKGKCNCAVLSVSLTSYNDSLAISNISQLKSSVISFREKSKKMPLILYIHWGLELQETPQKWQKKLAHDLIELGVDAIIGHHPHITQSIEYINGKPVFYSLGNFIADAYLPQTDLAYSVELEIKNGIESVVLIPSRLKKYFPVGLQFKQQLLDVKKHIRYSNIALFKSKDKWLVKPNEAINFSESTDVWVIAEKNSISTIKKINSKSYLLRFQKDGLNTNVINLHGKLSEFQIGDINNDNKTDVLVGISKPVRFDPTIKKRINIYTCQNNALQPLWLGTKFINAVESFDILKHDGLNYLTTIEVRNGVEKIKRIYEWDDFGFALTELN